MSTNGNGHGKWDGKIERRSGLTYEEFEREYLMPLRPVILTDATKKWKALHTWTPDFFRQKFATREIKANGNQYKVSDFIELVENSSAANPAPYLRNEYLPDVFPEVIGDVEPCPESMTHNWLADKSYPGRLRELLYKCTIPEIYIGGAGGGFPFLHYDLYFTHAYLNQIYGRKEFIIYPPEQSEYLYPDPVYKNQSRVRDPNKADLEKYPLFAKAVPTRFILEPGESAFLPAGWWHTTTMLTACITVSMNHANRSNWNRVVQDVRYELGRSHRFSTRVMAGPIAGYLSGVGILKSLANS